MAEHNTSNPTRFKLPKTIREGERNDTLFRYACSLRAHRYSDNAARRELVAENRNRCRPQLPEHEIDSIIRSAFSYDSGSPSPRPRSLNEVDKDMKPTEQAAAQLKALFEPDDLVTFVTGFTKNGKKWVPSGKSVTRTAEEAVKKLKDAESLREVFPGYNRQAGILFCINPVSHKGARKNADVTFHRNILVEYDDIEKEEQIARLLSSGLPIKTMTDSGNKSVHAIVKVDASDAKEYKELVEKLYKALEGSYGSSCDKANKNPARLSRLAGAQRGESVQRLLYTQVNIDNAFEASLEKLIPKPEASEEKADKPDCNEVAEALIKEHGACMVEGVPAIRKGGVYQFGQEAVYKEVIGIRPDARSNFRKEVMGYLDLMAPKRPQADSKYIRFRNGVLDIDTLELSRNDGTHLLLNEIPHDWNPEAKSELVDSTFESIAQGDEAVIANLWEMFGLSLYRGHDVSRMILLQGGGANGKSTLLDMLKCLLGVDNCFSLSIHELGEKFQLVPAMGKLALIGDDIASDFVNGRACAVMKKFVTGEAVNDQYKGGATFQFSPYATLIYSCNEIPRFADGTFGFERRIHPIPLTARFTPNSEGYDPRLKQKLCAEERIEYAIVKAVDALRAARERMGLTPNGLSERMKTDILRENDPAGGFIAEMTSRGYVFEKKTNSEVYGEFEDWCAVNGYEPVNKNKLSAKIKAKLGLQTKPTNGVRIYLPIAEKNA